MEILLHHDYLIQTLSSTEESSVLELCKAESCKGWVASTTIQALWQGLEKDERNKIRVIASYCLNKFSKFIFRSKINDLSSGIFLM